MPQGRDKNDRTHAAGLLPTAAQWRELHAAWVERAANPVLHYFCVARARRRRALPWWRRNLPPLLGLAVALGAGWAAWEAGTPGILLGAPLRGAQGRAILGGALLSGLVVFGMAWLAQGLFDMLVSAGCVLGLPGRRKLDLQLDSPLAASRLTAAELLVGLSWPVLWPMFPRLLVSAAITLACSLMISYDQSASLTGGVAGGSWFQLLQPWQQGVVLFPISLAALAGQGVLATAALGLLALCAGRGMHMDRNAGVLGALYSLGALFFILMTQMATDILRDYYGRAGGPGYAANLAGIEPLPFAAWLCGLLAAILLPAGLVKRRGAGLVLAYSLPLLFIGCFGALVWGLVINRFTPGIDPTHYFLDCLLSWSMFAPVSAIAVPHPACVGTGLAGLAGDFPVELLRWPLLVLAQLTLVAGLLRRALDAVVAERAAAG